MYKFIGSSEDHLVPMLVSGLRGHHVIDVACGSGDAHSLAVADDGRCTFNLHCASGSAVIVTVEHIGAPGGCQAQPHTHTGKKRKPMN